MFSLRKISFLLLFSISVTVALPVLSSSVDVAGATSASGLGQLDQGFGTLTGTSGVRSGIAESSGLSCSTQTSGLAYATDNSGAVTGIVAVGKEDSSSGTCSTTATTGIAAMFSDSGTDLWTNENVFSALNSVKVLPGSSGAIVAVGNSAAEPAIGLLNPLNGVLQSKKAVSVNSGLIASQGSFTSVVIGSPVKIQSGSGLVSVDPVYAVGSVTTSSGTELIIAAYGVQNPNSSSPVLVPIDGFGNQGSTSNLYQVSTSQVISASGVNVTDVALGSSGNIYVTGNGQHAVNGCTPPQLGFVLDYKIQSSVNSSGVTTYSGANLNNSFGSSGVYWFHPAALPSGQTVTCFDTSLNSILIDGNLSSGSVPPAILLGGYERTASNGSVESSVATLVGLNVNAQLDKAFGSSGMVLTSGGANSLNAANSMAYIPTPGQSSGTPSSIVVAGINYESVDSASNFEVGVSHYSLVGTLDTSFGSSGASLIPGCIDPDIACGERVSVQPDGSINLVGGINLSYKGLSVAQLTDREVQMVTTTPNLSVSSSQTPSADFTVTVSAPGDSGLVGIPGGVVADFTTVNGTGKSGYNYQLSFGKVVFPCNASAESITGGSITCNSQNKLSATIAVPTIYPGGATGSASFSLQITSVDNAGLASSIATVNITYPPPAPVTTSNVTTAPATTTTTTYSSAPVTTTTLIKSSKAIIPGQGYLVVTAKGQVFSYGDTKLLGSVSSLRPNGKIIAIQATTGNKGYWLVSSTGFVYAFGDAHNYGQPASKAKKKKISGFITGFVSTSNDKGYWLVSSTGFVYAFGDAHNYGQLFHKKYIGEPITIIAATNNTGYWIVTSKGMVYRFGKVRNYGSVKPKMLKGTITGAARASANKGYWLVSSTGFVYAFGDAHNYGYYGHANIKVKAKSSLSEKKPNKKTASTVKKKLISHIFAMRIAAELDVAESIIKEGKSGGKVKRKVANTKKKTEKMYFVSIEPTVNYKGYWLLSSAGNIFPYGDAKFYGSPAAKHLKNVEEVVVVP